MRIVVADSDPAQRSGLSSLLETLGHEPLPAASGRDALARLESSDASALIFDCDIPDLSGVEVAERIRAGGFNRSIYLFLVTSQSQPEDFARGVEAGADDFILKPVDPTLLSQRLRTAERLLRYERELQAKNRRLADDLAVAGQIQRDMLPQRDLRLGDCTVQRMFLPSQQVSGDIFNYFPMRRSLIGFYAADVSGHGVRAALLAASLGHLISADFFQEAAIDDGGNPTNPDIEILPERMAERLNRRFLQRLSGDSYFTLVCGVIDQSADQLTLCQAGQPYPLLIHSPTDWSWLGDGGTPLALFADAEFTRTVAPFGPGARLVVYSDGILDAEDKAGESFGEERFLAFLLARQELPGHELCRALAEELRRWTGAAAFGDDVSMIVFDRREQIL